MHELLPSLDVHLGGVSDVDTSRDLVNSGSDNSQEIIAKQAICNHILLGDIPELGDGLVVSDSLLDADDVCKQPLVLAWFQVVDAAEEVLVVGDGQTRYIISLGSKNLLEDLSNKEQVSCKLLEGEGFSC